MSDLTVGSIQALYENNRKSPLSKYPRVQIIWIRSVPTNGKTRYRALVSDGVYYMQAMLATQYAPVIEQGKIKKFTIVKLKETVLNVGDNNKMLIVLGLDVITVDVDSPIGNPVKLGGPVDPSSPVTNTANGRSMSMSSLQSLPQSPTPSLSQGLSPTQPTDDYSSQTPSSQSSRSFQPYPSTVNTGPSTQQPSYPQHGLSTPYVRPPNSMKLISMNKSHMNPYSSSQNSSVKPYYSSQNSNMNPHFSSQSNNINSYSSLQHNNINPYSSSQQGAYPSSQKNSVNLFSASSQPKRIITSTVPSRIPAPFMKISELSPYVKSWTLRARVSLKTPIRTWTNARSTGRLFSVNFVDETGEIGATGFNDQVVQFYDLLQDGQVYTITKAKITMNNKRFSNLTTDYELHLEHLTEIKLCPDDPVLPYIKLNLVKLSEINTYPLHSIVDVMGVVVEDMGMFEVIKRAYGGGKLVHKREIMIVDQSLQKVKFTLWDDEAREFDTTDKPVLFCKGARIANYQGAYLSSSPNTSIKKNPSHLEAQKLRNWYDSVGHCMDYQTFQAIGTDEISDKLPKVSISDATNGNFGSISKPDYFVIRATITYIKPDNGIYAGCPNCKKKLYMNEGQWWCERCEKVYEEPVWKYILTISIDDQSGQLFVNMFDEVTTKIFGITAQKFMSLKETDEGAADNLIDTILFHLFNFKIRARTDHFNGMERIKYQIMEMNEVDFVKESRLLVNDIFSLL